MIGHRRLLIDYQDRRALTYIQAVLIKNHYAPHLRFSQLLNFSLLPHGTIPKRSRSRKRRSVYALCARRHDAVSSDPATEISPTFRRGVTTYKSTQHCNWIYILLFSLLVSLFLLVLLALKSPVQKLFRYTHRGTKR